MKKLHSYGLKLKPHTNLYINAYREIKGGSKVLRRVFYLIKRNPGITLRDVMAKITAEENCLPTWPKECVRRLIRSGFIRNELCDAYWDDLHLRVWGNHWVKKANG